MQTFICRIVLFLFLSPLSLAAYAQEDAAIKTKWGYKGNIGPSRWSELSPKFILCSEGKAQSPINITKKVKPSKQSLQINYAPAPLAIEKNAITSLNINNVQTLINDGHGVQVNFPQDITENIVFNKLRYQLIQFHIHTPSETTIQGQAYPLEIHFVHQGANGKVAVLAVLASGGAENSEIQTMLAHLPTDQGKEHVIAGQSINPAGLLPMNKNYYSFDGSLTTPPCSEGVAWLVLEKPITVTPAQIARLRQAVGGNNARGTQSLNGRTILYSTQTQTMQGK